MPASITVKPVGLPAPPQCMAASACRESDSAIARDTGKTAAQGEPLSLSAGQHTTTIENNPAGGTDI